MKQEFIRQNGSKRLILFFTGWGMDNKPYRSLPGNDDIALCSRYTDLFFDPEPYRVYTAISVVSWSMGVWAGAHALHANPLPISRSIAINGTVFPIDQDRGIPPVIYEGTLNRLNEKNLEKFRRRMCGSTTMYEMFLPVASSRHIDDLKTELSAIARLYRENGTVDYHYDYAIVGMHDRIFPPAGQSRCWQERNTDIHKIDAAHYFDFSKIPNLYE